MTPPWRLRDGSPKTNSVVSGEPIPVRRRAFLIGSRNAIVADGEVHLWGLVGSDAERKALIALAEGVPGVTSVIDEMIPAY
jgi:hypothetical protein